jgi:hypothetical protein
VAFLLWTKRRSTMQIFVPSAAFAGPLASMFQSSGRQLSVSGVHSPWFQIFSGSNGIKISPQAQVGSIAR